MFHDNETYRKLFCFAVRRERSGRFWRWSLFQMVLATSLTSVILFFHQVLAVDFLILFALWDINIWMWCSSCQLFNHLKLWNVLLSSQIAYLWILICFSQTFFPVFYHNEDINISIITWDNNVKSSNDVYMIY